METRLGYANSIYRTISVSNPRVFSILHLVTSVRGGTSLLGPRSLTFISPLSSSYVLTYTPLTDILNLNVSLPSVSICWIFPSKGYFNFGSF